MKYWNKTKKYRELHWTLVTLEGHHWEHIKYGVRDILHRIDFILVPIHGTIGILKIERMHLHSN